MSSQATAKVNKKAVNCRIRYENEGDYSAVKGRDMLQVPQDKAFKNQNMPRENLSQNKKKMKTKENNASDAGSMSPCKPGPTKSAISSFAVQADICSKAAKKNKSKVVSPAKDGSESPVKRK